MKHIFKEIRFYILFLFIYLQCKPFRIQRKKKEGLVARMYDTKQLKPKFSRSGKKSIHLQYLLTYFRIMFKQLLTLYLNI